MIALSLSFICLELSLFVCRASEAVLSTSSAKINCSFVVDAEYGAPVNFPCNSSCISGNIILWKYYNDSNGNSLLTPKVLYNGYVLDSEWSLKGINVNDIQAYAPSVLYIENVTKSHTGIYECSGANSDSNSCKMQFCLTAGKFRHSH